MIKISHKKQKNDGYNWKCGAACLEMIFEYFKIVRTQDDIWNEIKSMRPGSLTQFYACTHDVIRYAIKNGLCATGYKVKESTCRNILEELDKEQVPAILLVKEQKTSQSHFIVYIGIKNKLYYYCDPNSSKDFNYMKQVDLEKSWSPDQQFGIPGYVLIVFDKKVDSIIQCANCGSTVQIVQGILQDQMESVICPYCGQTAILYS